jgi:glycosyltransferase involved in cell wall biosynthesis
MRLGIDISPLAGSQTGVGRFCASLLGQLLARSEGGLKFMTFSSGLRKVELPEQAGDIPHRHVPLPTRLLYRAWSTLGVPRVDRLLGGVDVYHATNYFLPPTKSARRVVTIYDVAFLVNPGWCSPKVVKPFAEGVKRFVSEADAVLVCSETTKKDLIRITGVSGEKITVTYGAADEALAPLPREEATEGLLRRYGLETPFFLFVGTLEPRKNVRNLLEGFAALQGRIPRHHLVLVGAEGWGAGEVHDAVARFGLGARVHCPGYVPRADLAAFYSAAEAFVLPSWYEGFGLPVLEAMACGCPVIASNRASLPEVTGDAGILVDPSVPRDIAAALEQVALDEDRRAELVARGHERVRRFSWEATADATLAVYRSLA